MRKFVFIQFLLILLAMSCKKENLCDCVKSTGKDASEKRDVTGFTKIKMEDKLDVYYTQTKDLSYSVEIRGGGNLIKLVKTYLDGDVLKIRNDNKCNFVRSYKRDLYVIVKSPELKEITNDGVGNFYCMDTLSASRVDYYVKNSGDVQLILKAGSVYGHLHGAGDAILSGEASNHLVNSTGQSFIKASNLKTGYTEIHYNSSGEARIWVTGWLEAQLFASGNVYYQGTPGIVNSKQSGSGKLIKE